jgi:hypothetical protein
MTFSADAYDNEMGITTQSCFQGTSILSFADGEPSEQHPAASRQRTFW